MKLFVIGLRGIRNVMGGIEFHCQQLYPRVAVMGQSCLFYTNIPQKIERLTFPSFRSPKIRILADKSNEISR
jgi:hypothetical protein